jgi:PAS domain S-box-containing protein
MVGLGLDGLVRCWNAGAERLLGHQAEQMIGRPVTTLAVDPTQAEIPTALRQLEAGGHLGHYETVWADHAGRPLAVSVTLSPVLDARGRVVGASAIARDVTRRKLAEEAHARLAAIVAASSEAIVGADADGVITSWNPGARRLFGHHASEVVGRRLAELLPADERGHWDEVVGLARGGQDTVRATLRLLHRQGYPIEAAVVVCPVRDASDAVAGLSLIGRPASAEGMSPRWQILTEAAQAWTRGEGAGQVLGALLRGAARAIDADAVSALRWDAATSELVALPTTAAPSPAAGAPSPSGPAGPAPAEARFPASGAAARAIAGRAPALVNDYASATDATPEAVAAGVRAAIAVPVIHRGRVVGVLQATLRRSDRRFGPDDVAFLEMAAPLVAGCLQELAAG